LLSLLIGQQRRKDIQPVKILLLLSFVIVGSAPIWNNPGKDSQLKKLENISG